MNSIGAALMRDDRKIVLDLRAEADDGTIGDARFIVDPTMSLYAEVIDHLGGLEPGESKIVPPWPDQVQDYSPDQPRAPAGTPEGGQWTKGGGGETELSQEEREHREWMALEPARQRWTNAAIANGLGRTGVMFSGKEHYFELNGTLHKAAATAHPGVNDNYVTVYPCGMNNDQSQETVNAMMAHEVMHLKFDNLLRDYERESDAVMKEAQPPRYDFHEHPLYKPLVDERIRLAGIMQNYDLPKEERDAARIEFDKADAIEHAAFEEWYRAQNQPAFFRVPGGDPVMRPDGTLKEPYASKYPLYTEWHKITKIEGRDGLAESDGVTEYSRQWWKDWRDGKVDTMKAVNETLAEMAYLKTQWAANVGQTRTFTYPNEFYHVGPPVPGSGEPERIITQAESDARQATREAGEQRWIDLYNLVERTWKNREWRSKVLGKLDD